MNSFLKPIPPVTVKSLIQFWDQRLKETTDPLNDEVERYVRRMLTEIKAPITSIEVGRGQWVFIAEPFTVVMPDGMETLKAAGNLGLNLEWWARGSNMPWRPKSFAKHRSKIKKLAELLDWWVAATGGRDIEVTK